MASIQTEREVKPSKLNHMNVATEYLKANSETVADWDGICGELANVIAREPDDHILYVEGDIGWQYHMVMLRDGRVHDAWCKGDALPVRQWLGIMFGARAWVELTFDGEDFWQGHIQDFYDRFIPA